MKLIQYLRNIIRINESQTKKMGWGSDWWILQDNTVIGELKYGNNDSQSFWAEYDLVLYDQAYSELRTSPEKWSEMELHLSDQGNENIEFCEYLISTRPNNRIAVKILFC
jgi:hypothetical protein